MSKGWCWSLLVLVLIGCSTEDQKESPPSDMSQSADAGVDMMAVNDQSLPDAESVDSFVENDAAPIDQGPPEPTPDVCGNVFVEEGEECDDANRTQGDGCSPLCAIEENFLCDGEPSNCQLAAPCSEQRNPCARDAVCSEEDERAVCACNDGFFGTGVICEPWSVW